MCIRDSFNRILIPKFGRIYIPTKTLVGSHGHISAPTGPIKPIFELIQAMVDVHMWTKFGVNRSSGLGCTDAQTDRQTDGQTDRQTTWLHKPWLGLKSVASDPLRPQRPLSTQKCKIQT